MATSFQRLLSGMLLLAVAATAAPGAVLQGRITDEKTGDELIGATVALLETTMGGFTDLDGRYRLDNVPPGTYELRVTYEFYQTKIVTDLVLAADQVLDLDVGLAPVESAGDDGSAFRIEDLRITASRVLSTPTAILANRMAAPTIGDAISAAQISLSPDATSGDALARVTGLMMVDDKYVFIRGMPDRYNTTMLDGVTVVGTDIDRDKKSFAYDLIPAGLLANMEVQKSGTPDMPGDLSGGTVKINTLEFPEQEIIKLTVSSGTNSLTTGEDVLTAPGSGSDWRAADDGSRALPSSLAAIPVNLGSPNNGVDRALRTAAARADLTNTYGLATQTAEPDRSASLAYGNRWFVRDVDEFGVVASLTWKDGFRAEDFHDNPTRRTVYNIPGIDPIVIETKDRDFEGTRFKRSLQLGGLLNLNYKLAMKHKLLVGTFRNRSALDQVTFRAGLPESGSYGEKTTMEWKERTLDLNKAAGEHRFLQDRLRLDWAVYRFETSVDEPDRKYVSFDEQPGPVNAPRVMALRENYRMWNANRESTDGYALDAGYEALGMDFKAGVLRTERVRDVNQLAFSYDNSVVSPANRGILEYGLGSIFIPENVSWEQGGADNSFAFDLATGFFGSYHAEQELTAAYLMGDREFRLAGADLRLVGGVRMEDSRIEVVTPPTLESAETIVALIDESNVLPSVNLTWRATGTVNLRGAYSRSLNRPEFRELSPISYYNFGEDRNIKGNPALTQAEVENLDLRLEYFPEPGEVLAVSVFRKNFTDAIEDTLQANPERFVQTWTNSPSARNYGFELEARKGLGFLAGLLNDFTVTANYFYVKSDVDYVQVEIDGDTGEPVATEKTRLLQGQAPWAVNVSLLWERPSWGTSVNVLYNRVGRRLDKVGDTEETSVYLMPRELLDVALIQRLGDTWRLKATVKNLLDEQETFLWGTEELPFETRAYGVSAGLSFAASF